MAQQNHDHRCHRKCQQHTGKTEQLPTGEHGEDHRDRMQPDAIAHQQWRQQHAFEHLPHGKHNRHADERIRRQSELEQRGDYRCTDADDEPHIGHDAGEPGQHANQQPQLEPHQHQAGSIDNRQRQHHQQLTTQERADDLVAFAHQPHHHALPLARQQTAQQA